MATTESIPAGAGSVNITPIGTYSDENATYTTYEITASANAGYIFAEKFDYTYSYEDHWNETTITSSGTRYGNSFIFEGDVSKEGDSRRYRNYKLDVVTAYFDSVPTTYTVSVRGNPLDAAVGKVKVTGKDYDVSEYNSFTDGTVVEIFAQSGTGYHFAGWYENGSKIEGADWDYAFEVHSSRSFTAQFDANTYTVRLHRNNSPNDGATANRSYTYGVARALPKIEDELHWAPRTGYTFLGWATSQSATAAEYTDGQSVINLTTENGGIVHLYAVWHANTNLLVNSYSKKTNPVTLYYDDVTGTGKLVADY